MNSSNLSATSGLILDALAKGETSIGYSVMKVGSMSFSSTIASSNSPLGSRLHT